MEELLEQRNSNCLKVVLYGPESTGKTTMAKTLASYFQTQFVPEYMRSYLQNKWDKKQEECTKEDLLPIALGQMQAENLGASKANKVLFLDTNLLQLKVYSEYYFSGYSASTLSEFAIKNTYDLFLLTNIDTPWVSDDLRDRPHDRSKLFRIFESELIKFDLPHIVLSGNHDQRTKIAIKEVAKLLEN